MLYNFDTPSLNNQLHGLVSLPAGERAPDSHWIGGWMGTRAGLEGMEKEKYLAPVENRTPAVQPVVRRYTD